MLLVLVIKQNWRKLPSILKDAVDFPLARNAKNFSTGKFLLKKTATNVTDTLGENAAKFKISIT